jgi:hypothetical protein
MLKMKHCKLFVGPGVVFFACLGLSSRAMASAPGCGNDGVGDIGTAANGSVTVSTRIQITAGSSYTYNYVSCFVDGNPGGWNHTITTAPQHGTLSILGTQVTYAASTGYVGTDYWAISQGEYGTVGADGAGAQDACDCNLTGSFNVVAPTAAPTVGQWEMTFLAVLLAGTGWYFLLPNRGGATLAWAAAGRVIRRAPKTSESTMVRRR